MITAKLPKDASEKIAKNYVHQLEEENARLLRRLVAAKEGMVWSGKGWVVHSYTDAGIPYTILELAGRPIDGIMDGEHVQVIVRRVK